MKNFLFVLLALLVFAGINACTKESDDVTGSGGNHNPNEPSNPTPSNNAVNVPRFGITLRWDCSDPDNGDTLRYDVIMGTTSNPNNILSSNQLQKSYYVILPLANTAYYWKIVAKDNNGLYTDGPVWKFTTGN